MLSVICVLESGIYDMPIRAFCAIQTLTFRRYISRLRLLYFGVQTAGFSEAARSNRMQLTEPSRLA